MGFYCSKMNSSFQAGKKKNFIPRRNISYFFFSFRLKGSNNVWLSVFHTWFTPSHTNKHTLTPTTHLHFIQWSRRTFPSTLSTFDFISFSFCVYFAVDKNLYSSFRCCCWRCSKRLRDTILAPTLYVYMFWALLDFPRSKRRMQFSCEKISYNSCMQNAKKRKTKHQQLFLLLFHV